MGLERRLKAMGCDIDPSQFRDFENRVTDGGIVLTHAGSIVMSSIRFPAAEEHSLYTYKLESTGMKHAGAVGMLEYIMKKDIAGVVCVRSSNGGLHVLFPEHG